MKQQENNIKNFNLININITCITLKDFDTEYWIKAIYDHKTSRPNPVSVSNFGGWQSESNIYMLPIFQPLCKLLQDEFYKISQNPSYIINSMWANISNFGHYNVPHTHTPDEYPYTKFSGVLYLATPQNGGNIEFLNPLNINQHIPITPIKNSLLIFPSPIPHLVHPNLSQEDRISIAFNFS